MQIVETEKLEWALIVPNTRGGDIYRKVIHTAQGGDGVSYDVRIELFSEGDRAYTAIRHRHDFEQLRFAVSGSMDLGFTTLNEGEVGYFPANAYYGPQKCAGAIILIAQWGDHFITKEASDRAVAELSETGKFSDGIYHGLDENGKPYSKDPLNAIWEQVFNRPYVPQPARYRQPIVMSPDAFGWSEPEGQVHRKGRVRLAGLAGPRGGGTDEAVPGEDRILLGDECQDFGAEDRLPVLDGSGLVTDGHIHGCRLPGPRGNGGD